MADVWSRLAPGSKPRLSREAIVDAAVALADAEGLAAVSIRRVATELGARTMSLYTYIAAKEELLERMADKVAGEVLLAELPADWREAISAIARQELAAARRHPWMVELIAHVSRIGPNALAHSEQTLAALAGMGLPAEDTVLVAAAVDRYVLGQVAFEVGGSGRPGEGTIAYLREAARSGDYPHLGPFLIDHAIRQDGFERGLGWLLDGIAADYGV